MWNKLKSLFRADSAGASGTEQLASGLNPELAELQRLGAIRAQLYDYEQAGVARATASRALQLFRQLETQRQAIQEATAARLESSELMTGRISGMTDQVYGAAMAGLGSIAEQLQVLSARAAPHPANHPASDDQLAKAEVLSEQLEALWQDLLKLPRRGEAKAADQQQIEADLEHLQTMLVAINNASD